MPAHEIVGLGIAQSPEGRHVFSQMSVHENLRWARSAGRGQKLDDDMARVFDALPAPP